MKKIKRIIFIIVTVILALLLILGLYNFISIKILKKDLVTINGYAVMEVVSGSMEPTINIGDLIIINTKGADYKLDDIVTFYDNNGSFVTHRIVDINDGIITTKGDSNNSNDNPIGSSLVVGKYVTRIKNLGRIISSFRSPFVMIMIFVIGVLVCVLVSTDKFGNPILDAEEQEFQAYLLMKNENDRKIKETSKKSNQNKSTDSNAKKKKSNTRAKNETIKETVNTKVKNEASSTTTSGGRRVKKNSQVKEVVSKNTDSKKRTENTAEKNKISKKVSTKSLEKADLEAKKTIQKKSSSKSTTKNRTDLKPTGKGQAKSNNKKSDNKASVDSTMKKASASKKNDKGKGKVRNK